MASRSKTDWGSKPIIVLIGLIASCIGICVFVTGIESIPDILKSFSPSPQARRETPGRPTVIPTPSPSTTALPTTPSPASDVSPTSTSSEAGGWEELGSFHWPVADLVLSSEHTIYVGFYEGYHGIMKSTNEGEDWLAVNNGLGELDIHDLTIAPDDEQLVYARTRTNIWKSPDGGSTWTPIYRSCGGDAAHRNRHTATVVSRDGTRLFSTDACHGSFIVDAISEQVDSEPFNPIGRGSRVFEVSGDPTILWGVDSWNDGLGVVGGHPYRSDDGGYTWWMAAGVGDDYSVTAIASVAGQPNVVYAGTLDNGLYRSSDGGGSWIPINTALPNQGAGLRVRFLTADPIDLGHVYAALETHGVFSSEDEGETWATFDTGLQSASITVMAISPDSDYLYVGTLAKGIWRHELP